MRFRFWNARSLFAFLAVSTFSGTASAQSFSDRSDAEFALLGPRIESGLIWDVERRRDAAICALTETEVRQKTRKSTAAVQQAALEVWKDAKLRCEARKFGVEPGYRLGYDGSLQGFHASAGIGGQFDLNASTDTNVIASALAIDPKSAASKTGLSSSGVAGQVGIGYDWNVKNLLSPARMSGTRPDGFVGVNLDVTFGGGTATVQGIPGIVPFLAPGVASMDTLRFRNNVTVDFTGRIGAYLTPQTGAYLLGGISATSVSFKYDCPAAGFCGVAPATPAFASEQSAWTYGGVIGAGVETKISEWLRARGAVQSIDAAAMSLYVEYRAHIMQPVDIDAGTLPTRYTSQRIDPSFQTVMGGARIRF